MRILAFESSAKAASVALLTDGALTGEYFQNSGQTHSRTLMKMAADLLENCELAPSDVNVVAWANGPGSFTGVRIGAAAAKGFCWGLDLPCAAVSTLEAMARQLNGQGLVCCCMDARRSQVYNALFCLATDNNACRDGRLPSLQNELTRLCEDRAIAIEDLAADLRRYDEPVTLVGDGAKLVYDALCGEFPNLRLAQEHRRHQRASGVALAAWELAQAGELTSARDVSPNYLRLSQAERERLEKNA